MPPARVDGTKRNSELCRLPTVCQKQADEMRLVGAELHENNSTMLFHRSRHLVENREVQLLALK